MSNVSRIYDDLPVAIISYLFSETCYTRIVPARFGDASGVAQPASPAERERNISVMTGDGTILREGYVKMMKTHHAENAMPTIDDVSRLANVSRATVSRVLTGTRGVREESREAVLRAVEELNYRPSFAAQNRRVSHQAISVWCFPHERKAVAHVFFRACARNESAEQNADRPVCG